MNEIYETSVVVNSTKFKTSCRPRDQYTKYSK